MKTNAMTIFGSLVLVFTSHLVLANDNQQSGRQGPPPEATTACENMSAGDSSSFEGPNGESVEGTCEEMNGTLILRPDNPPGGRQ